MHSLPDRQSHRTMDPYKNPKTPGALKFLAAAPAPAEAEAAAKDFWPEGLRTSEFNLWELYGLVHVERDTFTIRFSVRVEHTHDRCNLTENELLNAIIAELPNLKLEKVE